MQFAQTPNTPTDQDVSEAPTSPDTSTIICPADVDFLESYLNHLAATSTNSLIPGSNPDEATINDSLRQAVAFCKAGHAHLAREALLEAQFAFETSSRAHKLEPYQKVFDGVTDYLSKSKPLTH